MANSRRFTSLIISIVALLLLSLLWTSPGLSAPGMGKTYVYRCDDDFNFIVNIKDETAWLFLPGKTISAPLTPSASGVKYQTSEVVYWNKGQEALISFDTRDHKNCKNDAKAAIWESAKLRGIDFRAVGNEPGWHLEISHQAITYIGAYGSVREIFPVPEPETDQTGRRTVYHTKNADFILELQLEGRTCLDTMSGEEFETSVTVLLSNKKYQGCGRALH
jgi:uncharacterized membrane protein